MLETKQRRQVPIVQFDIIRNYFISTLFSVTYFTDGTHFSDYYI